VSGVRCQEQIIKYEVSALCLLNLKIEKIPSFNFHNMISVSQSFFFDLTGRFTASGGADT
jgi:hypothetical protein